MDSTKEKGIGVDEVFESFAKKKLQQLGIERSHYEPADAMSKLELRMKLRLEKTLANQNANSSESGKIEEYVPTETPAVKSQNENRPTAQPLTSFIDSSTFESRSKFDATVISSPKKDDVGAASINVSVGLKDTNRGEMSHVKNPKGNSNDTSPSTVVNRVDIKFNCDPSKVESVTSASKKDISIIKKKIELLKARSAEAKLKQVLGDVLESNDKEKCSKTLKSPSKPVEPGSYDSYDKHRKSRNQSRERHHSSKRSRRRSTSRSNSPSSKRRRYHRKSSRSRHHHDRSRSRERHKRSKKRSRSPRKISTKDKIRLLEIAKANALAQHQASMTASSVTSISQMVREGSMSVSQLTNLCLDIVSDKKSVKMTNFEPLTKDKAETMLENRETSTVHHPFMVKETPISIRPVKNILPPPPVVQKPIETLSKEFPVSCGQQHRKKEVMEAVYGKWEAVAKDETTKQVVKEIVNSDSVFIQPEKPNLDLSTAIAERISAVRELQMNPNDKSAKTRIETAQKALDSWTKSKQIIGQFTGDSRITAMSKNMLERGTPAWFKADALKNAKPVVGIGKSLLQKMGWKPGMCLGKSMPGQLEPLSVDFKTDRRGLSSYMEATVPIQSKKSKVSNALNSHDLSSKHPVSALTEVCSKRHWPPPEFRLMEPLNLSIFTFRVIVCNDEYIGKPAPNKKEAKKKAATVALQNMGLVPKT